MLKLPNEILFAIVDQVNEPETLVKLLVVSRQFNAIALRPLYQEISFQLSSHSGCRSMSTLCRDIHTNPGAQFTTTFATYFLRICGVRRYRGPPAVEHIIPYLVNVRRLCLTRQAASPGVLSLLPPSAQLTRLILDRQLCSEDFSRLLSYHPTLESIALPGSSTVDYTIGLTSGTLPNLRSLAAVFDASLQIENPMPSVLNLTILRHSDGPTVRHTVTHLPSIRTLAFQDTNFPAFAALAPYLPNLEYLQITLCGGSSMPEASVLAKFSRANLKYIQVLGSDQPGTAVVRRIFDSVTSLVVIDVEEDEYESLRWVRGFGVPIVVKNFDDDDCWRHWWERPGKDVEDICRRYKSEITKVHV
ncbi:hypothetical protein PTI98_003674 [Pleurotus ostreatus]|nr:hypothetical protein PTI98_003674 [Pleurotus ostreatus]